MGSTASICNATNCILNVALKQITPLYYENELYPNQCTRRDVGKVWFTLEAKLWNGENHYDTFKDIVLPITMISLAALSVVASGIGAGLAASAAGMKGNLFAIGKVIMAVGASTRLGNKIIQGWINSYAVRVHGLYMGSDRTMTIHGGPNCTINDGYQLVQYEIGNKFWASY